MAIYDKLHWLGHASFRWQEEGKIIYFDPWKLSREAPLANIVLISHEHFDHYSLEDIKLISSSQTLIISTKEIASQLQKTKFACAEIKMAKPQETINIAGIKIQAVPSYNTNKKFHTRASGKLGFIVDTGEIKLYHAGDTDLIPEMNDFKCDVALLPVSGTYVMTAEEAARAALVIRPKVAIPMHYGDIVGSDADAKKFQEILRGEIEVEILNQEK